MGGGLLLRPLVEEAICAYDRVIGLDRSEVSIDGSQHKAPTGGEGSGLNGADRGKLGWKWSLVADRWGIPIGWATDGANRHDVVLFPATIAVAKSRGLLADVETLHLGRGYESATIRSAWAEEEISDLDCGRQHRGNRTKKLPEPLGLRSTIEARTAGSATSVSYDDAPTARSLTVWPSSRSQSPSSSPPS
jgi:hypothetical protein